MHRRDLSKLLVGSAAAAAVIPGAANAQSACTPPCYPLTTKEQSNGLTLSSISSQYPVGDVRRYGALSSSTTAQNRQALQTAISACDATHGEVFVPSGINYGYVVTQPNTYPSFAGMTVPIVVTDQGKGNSYAGYPVGYDGMQVRMFYHTPQTTSYGQHDGNGSISSGSWHPYLAVNNSANLSLPNTGSRRSDDNRRASVMYMNDGQATWRLGQGTLEGAGLTDDQLSNFTLQAWNAPIGAGGHFTIFNVDRSTGHMYFNTDSNGSDAAYHFKTRTPGYFAHLVESLVSQCISVLRNSNGSSQDVWLKNNNGDFAVVIPALGDALIISKADRQVWIPGTLRLGNNYLWTDNQGKLRIKSSPPSSLTDGTVVGAQS